MPYALIPDGYSLKKVTKLQKQAVNDKRRHDDVVAFLSNETTPLLVGGAGVLALSPVLVKLFLQATEDLGVILSNDQKDKIKKTWLISLVPGAPGTLLGTELFKKLFGVEFE